MVEVTTNNEFIGKVMLTFAERETALRPQKFYFWLQSSNPECSRFIAKSI